MCFELFQAQVAGLKQSPKSGVPLVQLFVCKPLNQTPAGLSNRGSPSLGGKLYSYILAFKHVNIIIQAQKPTSSLVIADATMKCSIH